MDKKLLRIHSFIYRNVRQLPIINKNIASSTYQDFPRGKETEIDISIFSSRRVRVHPPLERAQFSGHTGSLKGYQSWQLMPYYIIFPRYTFNTLL